MIRFISGFAVFFVSFMGYIGFCKEKMKIRTEFLPITLVSSLSMILMFAGYLNLLKQTLLLVVFSGLVLFIYEAYKKRMISRNLINPASVIAILLFLLLFYALWGMRFIDGADDYTHWALIVREMLLNNRFPNSFDTIITFQSYPPAQSVWIYFFSKICGGTEASQMLANSLTIIFTAISFYALIDDRKAEGKNLRENVFWFIIWLIFSIFMITYNNHLTSLMVDRILPAVGISGMVYSVYYRKEIFDKFWYQIPLLCYLVTIKNSGFMFAFLIAALNVLFIFYYKDTIKIQKGGWIYCLIPPAASVLWFYIWKKHYLFVFPYGGTSQHAMSLDNYILHTKEKGTEGVIKIIKVFITTFFNCDKNPGLLVLCFIGTILIASALFKWDRIKHWNYLLIFIVVGYFLYEICLLAMYIFSMWGGESDTLNSLKRYNGTFVIFELGVILIYIISIFGRLKKPIFILELIYLFGMIVFLKPNAGELFIRSRNELKMKPDGTLGRYDVLAVIPERIDENPDRKYLVYIGDSARENVLHYQTIYQLFNENVTLAKKEKEYERPEWPFVPLDSIETFDDYDYVIVLTEDEKIQSRIKSAGLDYDRVITVR